MEEKGHKRLPSWPLIPRPDDHSTLWTILKVLAYVVGGIVLLVVAGMGLLLTTCALA